MAMVLINLVEKGLSNKLINISATIILSFYLKKDR